MKHKYSVNLFCLSHITDLITERFKSKISKLKCRSKDQDEKFKKEINLEFMYTQISFFILFRCSQLIINSL